MTKKVLVLMYTALFLGFMGASAYAQGMGNMGGWNGAMGSNGRDMMGNSGYDTMGAGPSGGSTGDNLNTYMGPGGNGMMSGWQTHGTMMMDFGAWSMNGGLSDMGAFPDGSNMYILMPHQFDGYHHMVISRNDSGNITAIIMQPDGQPGQYWNNESDSFISHMFLEWMGGNSYRVFSR